MGETSKSPNPLVSLALPVIITGVLLAIFLIAVFIIDWLKPTFSPIGLLLTGVIMALIPAALWLFFFYQQDRREPEPKSLVLQVFILGGLLAYSLSIPIINGAFEVSSWIYTNLFTDLLGGILVIGFTQEFLKYAAVRFSVFNSSEFDEETDGIIYATAAGLGFATVMNINFIVESGGAELGIGAVRIILMALAQASIAGITGYFLGREKLENRPVWWMPTGVILAAIVNGIFFFLQGNLTKATITAAGAFVNPWIGLFLAIILAVGIAAVLTVLIAIDQKRGLLKKEA